MVIASCAAAAARICRHYGTYTDDIIIDVFMCARCRGDAAPYTSSREMKFYRTILRIFSIWILIWCVIGNWQLTWLLLPTTTWTHSWWRWWWRCRLPMTLMMHKAWSNNICICIDGRRATGDECDIRRFQSLLGQRYSDARLPRSKCVVGSYIVQRPRLQWRLTNRSDEKFTCARLKCVMHYTLCMIILLLWVCARGTRQHNYQYSVQLCNARHLYSPARLPSDNIRNVHSIFYFLFLFGAFLDL